MAAGMVQAMQRKVYGQNFQVRVLRQVTASVAAPRLVVVAYQPNSVASDILRLCIKAIRKHTPEEHELWVIDNASPAGMAEWLADEPEINVIFNRTQPLPRRNLFMRLTERSTTPYQGSYANAVALELAAQTIDADSRLMMTLHMDTMPCQTGWLSHLASKMDDTTRCVGVRLDQVRVRTVHVLGMLFDFTLFKSLGLSFAHDMPRYDTGDGVSLALVNAGYRIWACPNSLWEPGLLDCLPIDSPYREIKVDRSFDDQMRIIFLHLGRGVLKSQGDIQNGKTPTDEWLRFGHEIVLTT